MATKDLTLHVSSKLGGEWSAPGVAGLLTGPSLEYLVSKWGSLDTMVKTRLLMAPLLLPSSTIESLNPALADMIEVARADKDEWVRVMASLAWPYTGRLHVQSVASEFRLVDKALSELTASLASLNPAIYRPEEESFLEPDLLGAGAQHTAAPVPAHRHFRARPRSEAPSQRLLDTSQARAPIAPQRRGPIMPRNPSHERGLANNASSSSTSAGAERGGGASMFMPTVSSARRAAPAVPDIFLSSRPPARPTEQAGARGAEARGQPPARRTVALDISTVAALNQQAAAEKERKAQEEREARELAARKRAEALETARQAARAARDAAREAAKLSRQQDRDKKRKHASGAEGTKESDADKAVGSGNANT